MYSGGTLFHDHASGFIYAENQVGLGVSDTLKAKRNFDALAEQCGHEIKSFCADNGVYTAKDFKDDLLEHGQTITFCGVGAHAQNGAAERSI